MLTTYTQIPRANMKQIILDAAHPLVVIRVQHNVLITVTVGLSIICTALPLAVILRHMHFRITNFGIAACQCAHKTFACGINELGSSVHKQSVFPHAQNTCNTSTLRKTWHSCAFRRTCIPHCDAAQSKNSASVTGSGAPWPGKSLTKSRIRSHSS